MSLHFVNLDVVDWILEHINQERTRRGIMKKLKEMYLIVNSKVSFFAFTLCSIFSRNLNNPFQYVHKDHSRLFFEINPCRPAASLSYLLIRFSHKPLNTYASKTVTQVSLDFVNQNSITLFPFDETLFLCFFPSLPVLFSRTTGWSIKTIPISV